SPADQRVHEQVQEARVHRVQRRPAHSQLSPQRPPARVSGGDSMRVTEAVALEPDRLVVTPPVVSPRTFASSASGRWAEGTVRVGVALTGTGLVWGAPHSIYGLLGAASVLVGPVCVWSCGRVGEPPGGSSHRSNSSKASALEEHADPFHGMAWAKSSNSCGGPPDTSAAPPFHRPSARSPLRRS